MRHFSSAGQLNRHSGRRDSTGNRAGRKCRRCYGHRTAVCWKSGRNCRDTVSRDRSCGSSGNISCWDRNSSGRNSPGRRSCNRGNTAGRRSCNRGNTAGRRSCNRRNTAGRSAPGAADGNRDAGGNRSAAGNRDNSGDRNSSTGNGSAAETKEQETGDKKDDRVGSGCWGSIGNRRWNCFAGRTRLRSC